MLNILKELRKTQELAEFYTNGETETFEIGIVIALNDDILAFQSFTKNGYDDGIVVFPVNSIFRVETNTQYLNKMKKLILDFSITETAKKIDNGDIINSLLQIALQKREIVSVKLLDNDSIDFTGFVERIENEECKFKIIDEYGFEDGFGYANINDITEMSYMCEYDKRIFKLWQFNQKNEK